MKTIIAVLFMASAVSLAQVPTPEANQVPTRQFGHARLDIQPKSASPNLVEGREFNGPQAIALDTSVSPPILYVFDTNNNRVLAFRNPDGFTQGQMADKVIGQRDLYSTVLLGPGTTYDAGLRFPVGGGVDSNGNLYVIDAGNNRILRYPRPLEQQSDLLQTDLVIGQRVVSVGTQPNQGETSPSAKTLALTQGNSPLLANLTFDAAGNLWVTDAGNNRVIRYPTSELTPNKLEPQGDLFLGQFSANSNAPPTFPNNAQTNGSTMGQPADLAFDAGGGLYVADGLARVLYFASPSSTGQVATRVLGIQPVVQGQTAPPRPTQYSLGTITSPVRQPTCVFTRGFVVFVCDAAFHRIVRYDPPGQWPAATENSPSPPQAQVYGQVDFGGGDLNRGLSHATANSFVAPRGGLFLDGDLWVVDTGNNRVLSFPASSTDNYNQATRVIGQLGMEYSAINLIEGRELFLESGTDRAGAIVVDTTSTPNHIYVADPYNNRVLGFLDSRSVGVDVRTLLTTPADLVIGQPDRFHNDINYPNADPLLPSPQGLFLPTGLDVDAQGNLYVADSGNGRVIRFPRPFDQGNQIAESADLVLGQFSLTSKTQNASNATMSRPYSVAVFNNGGVAVSDAAHNRVLLFRSNGGTFTNGQTAYAVIGQQDFNSTGTGNGTTGLNGPRGLAVDTGDRLYICDTSNNRVVVYGNTAVTPSFGLQITGVNRPHSVAVSAATGQIWVADTFNNRLLRYREFNQLQINPAPEQNVPSNRPIAIALDGFDNIIVADYTNRLLFHFGLLLSRHGANFTGFRGVSPGQILGIGRIGKDFAFEAAGNPGVPYPKQLSGIEVLVNGVPAPIFRVDATAVWLIVPWDAPTTGTAEFLVQRPSTGEVLAARNLPMVPSNPGFFTLAQNGLGNIAATNLDKDAVDKGINRPDNGVDRDGIITFWMTGLGRVNNPPPDGEAPNAALSTPVLPQVFINAAQVPSGNIIYSGVSPQFPGLYQVNVKLTPEMQLPATVGNNLVEIPVAIIMNDVGSNFVGATATADAQMFVNPSLRVYFYAR